MHGQLFKRSADIDFGMLIDLRLTWVRLHDDRTWELGDGGNGRWLISEHTLSGHTRRPT
jgi:hypothetical protein